MVTGLVTIGEAGHLVTNGCTRAVTQCSPAKSRAAAGQPTAACVLP